MTTELSGYERARVMFPDYNGLARGKYLPAHLASKGTGHCVTLWGLGYDRSMIPAPGSRLLEGLVDVHATLDPTTLRPGWEDDRTAVGVADLAIDGEPFEYAPRYVLQQAIAAWAEMGLRPKVGLELEAYLLQPKAETKKGKKSGKDTGPPWERLQNPRALVYGTGYGNDPTRIIDAISTVGPRSNFRIESMNAEFDESQYELTLEYDEALVAADDAFLFRVMARELALVRGYDLTFLGKPFADLSGSGLHINVSLVDAFGANAFVDEDADDGLSEMARHAIAGLCRHHEALVGLCAPNVNAYRRLIPGDLAGYWANWGYDHRAVATRVPPARGDGTRLESRVADGAANIHLAVAGVLTAARLGVMNELAPPPAETGNGFDEVGTQVCAPGSLADGLRRLENNAEFCEALGQPVVDNFLANKRAEWDRFIEAEGEFDRQTAPTVWEMNEYLPYH